MLSRSSLALLEGYDCRVPPRWRSWIQLELLHAKHRHVVEMVWFMAKYIVKQGDCFSSIAARHGLDPETLYNDAGNTELKGKRPFLNILAPGDEVEVQLKTRTVDGQTDKLHTFVLKRPKVKFRVFVANLRREPYEDKPYVLKIGSRETKGRTQTGGLIECEIPAHEQSGHLRIWWSDDDEMPILERDLAIGHLDPISMTSGIQGRLLNLGFVCDVTGKYDFATLMALRRFRFKNDLPMPAAESDSSDSGDTGESGDTSESSDSDDTTAEGGSDGSDPTSDDADADSADPADECEKLVDDALRSKLKELYEG